MVYAFCICPEEDRLRAIQHPYQGEQWLEARFGRDVCKERCALHVVESPQTMETDHHCLIISVCEVLEQVGQCLSAGTRLQRKLTRSWCGQEVIRKMHGHCAAGKPP